MVVPPHLPGGNRRQAIVSFLLSSPWSTPNSQVLAVAMLVEAVKTERDHSFLFLTEHHELHAETGAVRLTLDCEAGLDHGSTGPLK